MFPILLFLFIFVPIIEIALFVQVGGVLGMWPTIGLVLLTAVVGASLVRSQGLMTLMSVQSRLQQGEMPAQQILEGVMLAVCGVLLLTPGFMTDAMGMIVLLPAPRAALAKSLMKRMTIQTMNPNGFQGQGDFQGQSGFHGGFGQQADPFQRHRKDGEGDVFEGEFEHKSDSDDENNRLR
ncbi:FxsA family protein [Thaumasiovibrio subtropicus]|uniref:FxsA family protein n=1 Tax=Thaumasiovibrio subtropicus TaxID=1891207 RepID=UPI000B35C7FC|nr:FxsA family protein [Thaumasiovibrio subtropicus]